MSAPNDDLECGLDRAAALLGDADALLVTAGAGIGVDSGLPDFRGDTGFWRAYPALGARGIDFATAASPASFHADARLAWGFYGHRLAMYRRTVPHDGFTNLLALGTAFEHGLFVYTSDVDGQFATAGFPADRVCEVHGSIHHLQCLGPCHDGLWTAEEFEPEVDDESCTLTNALPRCERCGQIARSNVLMFDDGGWVADRARHQERRLAGWLRSPTRVAVVEIGAGTAIATVRRFGARFLPRLVRINPAARAAELAQGAVIPLGARDGIAALVDRVAR